MSKRGFVAQIHAKFRSTLACQIKSLARNNKTMTVADV